MGVTINRLLKANRSLLSSKSNNAKVIFVKVQDSISSEKCILVN